MKVLFWLLVASVLILLWIAGAVFVRVRKHQSGATDEKLRSRLHAHLQARRQRRETAKAQNNKS